MDVTKPLLHQSSSDSRLMRRLLTSLVVVTIYWWAVQGTNTSLTHILEGIPFMAGYIKRMFPPDLSIINRLLVGSAETIQIAITQSSLHQRESNLGGLKLHPSPLLLTAVS